MIQPALRILLALLLTTAASARPAASTPPVAPTTGSGASGEGASFARYAEIDSKGDVVDLSSLKVPGKISIIALSSLRDPSASFLHPFLEHMVDKIPDLVVRVVGIDRPGKEAPDWDSPIAMRNRLRDEELPFVKIYGPSGELFERGDRALTWVEKKSRKLPPPRRGKGPYPVQDMQGPVSEITNGNEVDFNLYLAKGKKNVIMFHSPFCPPCKQMRPLFETLARKNDDYVLRKIDVNRPGTWGIDYGSPVGAQYGIRMLPFFLYFDEQTRLRSWGSAVFQHVEKDLRKANGR